MLCVSWTERSNTWVRQTVGVPEDQELLAQLKKRKLAIYGHWKRRPDSIVLATIEGEVEGKVRPGKQHGLITSEHGQMADWELQEKMKDWPTAATGQKLINHV